MIAQVKLAFVGVLAATAVLGAPIRRRAVDFSSVDISRRPGDGSAAQREAQAVCPQSDGVEVLEDKRQAAEAAETDVFNPAIEAAGNDELEKALNCQKNRNKVLKNTCQLMRALIENDQSQIDENNKQISANAAKVNELCPDANASLFIGGGAAAPPARGAATADSNNDGAEANNQDSNNDTAEANNTNNNEAEANNNNNEDESNNNNNNEAEVNNNNNEDESNNNNNNEAEANNNNNEDESNNNNNNEAEANNECSNNANNGNSNNGAAQNNENPNNAVGGAIQFGNIDISKTGGGGNEAQAAAKSVCPSSDGADLLEAKRKVAEDAERNKFNPAIEAAKASNNEALETALECQKNRNKVLKNSCQLESALLENEQGQIDENNQQIPKNMEQVDKFCPNADASLFI